MGKSTYIATNSELNLIGADGKLQLEKDQESAREYFQQHVNPSTRFFLNTGEKYRYMLEKNLYESEVFDRYNREDVIALNDYAFSLNHRFDSFMGARKFYNQYALLDHSGDSELDGPTYLERFEDRVVTTALSLADGDLKLAYEITDEIISGRYQPATPTFLNAGRTARGEQVSCFPAGTPIDTLEGQIDIDLIQVGDKVLSHDGRFHEVEKVIVNENTSPLVSVSHYGHMNPILCTPEHPILVWTDRDVETLIDGDGAEPDKGIVWLKAQDIDADHDFILMTAPKNDPIDKVFNMIDFVTDDSFVVAEDGFVRKLNQDKKRSKKFKYNQGTVSLRNAIPASTDLGLVLGWYIAEGHCSKRNSAESVAYNGVHFTLGQHEEEFIAELDAAFNRLFGIGLKYSPSRKDGSIKLSCHSGILARFLSSLVGSGFADKRVTSDFLNFGDDFLRAFLIGVFRGDGCMTSGSLVLDLVNPEIVDQIQLILLNQGIIARVRQYHNAAGNLTGHISVPGISGTNENFIYDVKKNLHNYAGLRGTVGTFYRSIHGKIAFGLRAKVSATKSKPEKVYNLHVADTHTYSVRGAIVHNCFLIRMEDSMESISRGHNAALQLSKRGGGVALLLTNLRELGAPIKGIPNAASGVVPVMKMLEDAFSYANQLGARQGAGAVYLNAHHPDILRFLDTKRENADEKVRIKTLSMGVVIPDITFELAKKNEAMYLFSPYDVERVYGVPMSDLSITEHYYDMIADDRIKKYQISARELFTTIAEIQFESGYPYILFEDTANKTNPIKGRINMSNLCVTGDTNILTADGYRNVKELFDSQEEFDVIVDTRARDMDLGNVGTSVEKSTPMFKTALNADVFKVTTSEGFELRATEWHKMYVVRDGELVKIALADVVVGDKLLVQSAEGGFGAGSNVDLAYLAGVIAADGTIVESITSSGNPTSTARVYLYGDKSQFAGEIEDAAAKVLLGREDLLARQSVLEPKFVQSEKYDRFTLSSAPLAAVLAAHGVTQKSKTAVPNFVIEGGKATQIAYLSGLYQMDASITGTVNTGVSIELGSIDHEMLVQVQRMLLNLGVYTRIYANRKADYKALLPDGRGGLAEYNQKKYWTLRATGKCETLALYELLEWSNTQRLGWEKNYTAPKKGLYQTHRHLATVTSITADGTEAVYDVTVDNGNSVIFNGIATGNCSEILQTNTPSTYNDDLSYDEIGQDISCNLGSLNIAKAMESPDFAKTVEVAIRALTAVTDQTSIDSVPSIRKANEEGRSIGLGQMNLHGFFGRERIHYGSPESVEFTSVYFAMVAYHALQASNMIAIERGDAFSDFADSAYADGSYFDKYVNQDWVPESDTVKNVFDKYGVDIPTREDWQQLKESVMEFGIYHRYLQAVPPTGSISYINGSTSSIHPIASRIEIRKESKVGRVYYPAAYMTNDNLEFYRDAYEIGPEKIIDVYAAASEHVDQGLSLTLFYPDTATTRDLNKYWIYAWRTGKIKTLYYARIRQAALEGTQSDSCVSCTL